MTEHNDLFRQSASADRRGAPSRSVAAPPAAEQHVFWRALSCLDG
jgi:hypothetical protein